MIVKSHNIYDPCMVTEFNVPFFIHPYNYIHMTEKHVKIKKKRRQLFHALIPISLFFLILYST